MAQDPQKRQQLLAAILGAMPQPNQPTAKPPTLAGAPPDPSATAQPPVLSDVLQTLFPQTPSTPQPGQAIPAKPMSQDPTTGQDFGYVKPPPSPTDAYALAHPGTEGQAPPAFTPETTRHALLRGVFAGMSEFGRPGAGFAQNAAWDKQQEEKQDAARNWPLQREANIKNAMNIDLQQEKTQAEIAAAKATADNAKRNYPTQQQVYGKWLEDAGDDPGKRRLAVDMIARAETASHPGTLDPFRLYVEQYTAQHPGQTPTYEMWQEAQAQGAKQGTMKPEIIAQVGPEPDPRTYPLGTKDPEYQKAAVKWGADYQAKLQAENEATAIARGQAYGQYRPVQVIDPADGKEKTMWAKDAVASGAAGANQGIGLMSKEAQIGDIEFASEQAREAIKAMPPLDAGSIATLTMAMRETDPTVFSKLKDTLMGSQQLNPQQKAFMTWILQLNERAMSLRNIAGMGQGAQDLRSAIQATLPGLKSGDKDLMLQQLDAFDNQVRILKGGIPTVNHPAAPQVPPKGSFVWDDKGERFTADGTHPLPKGWSTTKPAGK